MRKFVIFACCSLVPLVAAQPPRWTAEQANTWYAQQPWPVGSNYLPADAINELEMWQADSFDPKRIDLELGWAQGLGMTTMRVFLHDLLWEQDSAGFKKAPRYVSDHRERAPYQAAVCVVRFLLGSESEIGQTACANAGRPQFGLGTESGCECAGR